jgi:hypothetical protein
MGVRTTYYRLKPLLLLALLACIVTGCKKLVQVNAPDNWDTTETVFANDSLAQQAVAGLYIKIMSSSKYLFNGGMSVFPALSADELTRTTVQASEDQFTSNSLLADNQLVLANIWKPAYYYIYQCNICINGLQRSTAVNSALKDRLTGEVKFVRALCYFYLVNLFGDVPLALSTNADVNAQLSRTAVSNVYDQITGDLQSAIDLLNNQHENTLPSQLAAQALLARVYLYRQQWDKAEAASSLVIDAGKYSLTMDLTSVFKSSSREIIFQWAPVLTNFNSVEGALFIPVTGSSLPAYMLRPELLAAFEANDLRKAAWTNSVKLGATTYYYPYKYRVRMSATPSEYNVVLRLGEQYLIRAEARAQQQHIADAVADINMIRGRAQVSPLPASMSQDDCLEYIERERRTELFAEWGHRWFDLKRTSRTTAVLSSIKGNNWSADDRLYPIPVSEIEEDMKLTQNPGYE